MIISRRLATLVAMSPFGMAALARDAQAASAKHPEAAPSKKPHRVAVHINSKDTTSISLALNNVRNMFDYYREKGERIEIRIVAHGPGLNMFREDTSTVKERLASMRRDHNGLTFAACANTKRNMEKEEGKPISITPMAEIVPSGVVELVALQEKGWSYLHP